MDVPSWRVRSSMILTTVKIVYFTLRKSNLASQRVFCTISMMKGAEGFQAEADGSLPLVVVANATNANLKTGSE